MNASLTVENVNRIKSRIIMNVGVSVKVQKNILCGKKL